MSSLRFALIGCGSIARKHAHVLHNYLPDAEIAAFVDVDEGRSAEFSKKFAAPAFTSVHDMMHALGDRVDDRVEITTGLAAGDVVAADPKGRLVDGARVKGR